MAPAIPCHIGSSANGPRQPTPDHPPYCWMIGEAIDKLGEDGGSAVDSISSFIRAAHPGVPAAHDRFLRHYLAKHVAEGFFVCTAQGRYARSPAEAEVGSSEAARVETPVAQIKRGRGRPRKDGSSSAPPAVKKDGSGGSSTPKRRGRPRGVAPLTSGDGSVPSSSVAAALAVKKDGSSSAPPAFKKDCSGGSTTPKRRGRPRGVALLTYGDRSVPSSPVAALTVKKDAWSSAPPAVKKDGSGQSPTPWSRGRPRSVAVAPLTSGDSSVPSSSVAATDESGSQATASVPRRRRLRKLATITDVSGEVTEKEDDGMHAPSPTGKDQTRELALMTVTDVPAPMPPMDNGESASFNLTLVVQHDDIPRTSTEPERRSQASELALVAAYDSPVRLLVADKTDGDAAPSKYRHRRQPRQPSPTSAAGKKARGKTLSATPKAKDRRQRKSAVATTFRVPAGGGGGKGAPSIVPKPHDGPNRLYPLTADEIPDDPTSCLLALPAPARA